MWTRAGNWGARGCRRLGAVNKEAPVGHKGYEVWFEGWEGEMGGKARLEDKFDPVPG